MLTRCSPADDARSRKVMITEQGCRTHADVYLAMDRPFDQLARRFSEHELQQLLEPLRAFRLEVERMAR